MSVKIVATGKWVNKDNEINAILQKYVELPPRTYVGLEQVSGNLFIYDKHEKGTSVFVIGGDNKTMINMFDKVYSKGKYQEEVDRLHKQFP